MRRSLKLHNETNTFTALMVGYYAVGKSAILSRFSRSPFQPDYQMTLSTTF